MQNGADHMEKCCIREEKTEKLARLEKLQSELEHMKFGPAIYWGYKKMTGGQT